jgi:hypothetical protein
VQHDVAEVTEAGRVPELKAVSTAETMILLVDGEELVGARQNRILNTSLLLAPKSATVVPVSCVEQGRWRYTAPDFKAGDIAPARLRARKGRAVHMNLRACGKARSDQGEVWEEVAEQLADAGAASPTMAAHDAVEQHRGTIEEHLQALPWPDGSCGVIVAIGGRFAAADLFDRPETLRRLWPRLVAGYAMDALAQVHRPLHMVSATSPQAVLERLGQVACERHPSVGVGEDWRFEADDLTGQALVADGTAVHISVFPNISAWRDLAQPQPPEQPIQPPSERRRRRGRTE